MKSALLVVFALGMAASASAFVVAPSRTSTPPVSSNVVRCHAKKPNAKGAASSKEEDLELTRKLILNSLGVSSTGEGESSSDEGPSPSEPPAEAPKKPKKPAAAVAEE